MKEVPGMSSLFLRCVAMLIAALLSAVGVHAEQGSTTSTQWTKHIIHQQAESSIPSAVASDLDGDGHLDVMASFDSKVFVFPGPDFSNRIEVHDRHQHVGQVKPRPSAIHSTLMDVDGDGRPDIACGAKGGEGFPNGQWFCMVEAA
jgi:hypothetical protein